MSELIMKILLIVPTYNYENLIVNILNDSREINYSFYELINILKKPGQILQTKIHTVFGIRYVDKDGINEEKLMRDIEDNPSLNLKWIKLKKWLFKIWTKKTKSERVSFYIVTPDFYNGLTDIYGNIRNIIEYFDGCTIAFLNQETLNTFDAKNFLVPFNSIVLHEDKDLKEIILGYVNNTIF